MSQHHTNTAHLALAESEQSDVALTGATTPATEPTPVDARRVALARRAILSQPNTPARDVYGEIITIIGVLVDARDKPRTIKLPNGETSSAVYKSCYHTNDGRWIDSYTLACAEFAHMVIEEMGGDEFADAPIQIVFAGQVTRRRRSSGDATESDTVRFYMG